MNGCRVTTIAVLFALGASTTNDGGLEILGGNALEVSGSFENTNEDPDNEYQLTVGQGGLLNVGEDLLRVEADLAASGGFCRPGT